MITRVLWNLLWIPRDDTSRGWLPGRKIPSYTYSGCVACTALSLMGQRRVEQKMKLLRLSWKAKGNFLYIRQLFLSSMVNRTERATLFAMSRCCCCNCIFYFLCHHQCGIQFLSSGLLTYSDRSLSLAWSGCHPRDTMHWMVRLFARSRSIQATTLSSVPQMMMMMMRSRFEGAAATGTGIRREKKSNNNKFHF